MRSNSNRILIGDTSLRDVPLPVWGRSGPSGLVSRRLYHLIGSISDASMLGRQLLRLAEHAAITRENEALEEISDVMCGLPLRSANEAGLYYQALLAKRTGDRAKARSLLEQLSDGATSLLIRARALGTVGALSEDCGDIANAARVYSQSLKLAAPIDKLTFVNVQLQLSALSSTAGDHHAALDQLARLWPTIRAVAQATPYYFYCFQNEAACELLALGRIEQAAKYSAVATASPIAEAYPEWRETAREIAERASAPVIVAVGTRISVSQEQGGEVAAHSSPVTIHPSPTAPAAAEVLTAQTSIIGRVLKRAPPTGPPACRK
jgi:hypothetical protein